MTLTVVPDLLRGIELRGVGRELVQVQPGTGFPDRRNGQSLMNRALISQQDDRAAQMAQEHVVELGPVHRLEIVRLHPRGPVRAL